ncbi:site-specific integrase [Staphylococcus felis]|uniref:Site-specific integrase n=1 Tax=Staphylococcus felis TaxID=46127 RepID=A0AAX1RVX2_9STAP|nr:site-specific integrase [Staphylococcus felis]REH77511.1 site-specific integrase [Staphylococcus felis]REH81632.1 site-specific integrase [Staphylococcus felis]REH82667.1 site-specific integrase [Staphylococcus felis]REI00509.1 site-specific integrase [Staphylococcus felis]REI14612.1 site-specific integrase [Staphylococcus felis]
MIKKYKKKDGTTAYMFVAYLGTDPITGKQKRTTRRGFNTERDAKIAEARLQTEVDKNGFLNNDITTFEEVYKLWLEQYENTVRESTYQRVLTLFDTAILEHFKDIPVKKITVPYCQKVINKWNKQYSDMKAVRIYASNVLNYAVNLKIIADNPFNYTKAPRKKEAPKDPSLKYYSSDELRQFLSFVEDNPLYYAMFRTLAFTGFRRGELMALTWNDIDFNKQTITINKTYARGLNYKLVIQEPKTKSSLRTISVDDKTASILKTWRIHQRVESLKYGHNTSDKHQPVFTDVANNKPLYPEHTNKVLNAVCDKHNFKRIKVHGFRHTHCSLLFEAGLSIQEVQDRLGHGDIKTTMDIYAHVTEKQRDQVAEKFANYINF